MMWSLRRVQTVYPRWRGEHISEPDVNNGNGGLSPLARGTHNYITGVTDGGRFIPAGAGNTGRDQRAPL